jgi:DNA-binding transcriptional LysR family regulator
VTGSAGHKVDTTLAAQELAASGAGCALTHALFVGAYFATGRLVTAVDREFPDDNSYFVVMPERPQRPRREARLFRDWLMTAIAARPVATAGG